MKSILTYLFLRSKSCVLSEAFALSEFLYCKLGQCKYTIYNEGATLYVIYYDIFHPVTGFRVKESDKIKISAKYLDHGISLGSYKPSHEGGHAHVAVPYYFLNMQKTYLTSPSPVLAKSKEDLLPPRVEEIAQKHQVGKTTREV